MMTREQISIVFSQAVIRRRAVAVTFVGGMIVHFLPHSTGSDGAAGSMAGAGGCWPREVQFSQVEYVQEIKS